MDRMHYWVCVADADNPAAVRIEQAATGTEAFRKAFGMDYVQARHHVLDVGSHRREVTTDKRRAAWVSLATEQWRAKVGDREVVQSTKPRKLRRHVVTLACDTDAAPEKRRRAFEDARVAYKRPLLADKCAFTDAESDEWSDD